MPKSKKLQYQALASFSKEPVWNNTLKPRLESMKAELAKSDSMLDSFEEAGVRDIQRSTTNKVINDIIRFIERAEEHIK